MLEIYAPYVTDTAVSFETDAPSADEFSARIEMSLRSAPWLVFDKHDEILGYAYATQFRARAAYDATRETSGLVGHAASGGDACRRRPGASRTAAHRPFSVWMAVPSLADRRAIKRPLLAAAGYN